MTDTERETAAIEKIHDLSLGITGTASECLVAIYDITSGVLSRPDADTVPVPRSELWALHDGITRRYVSFDTIAHALSDWLLGEESR